VSLKNPEPSFFLKIKLQNPEEDLTIPNPSQTCASHYVRFIVPDDGSGDVFVHQSAINVQGFRSLAEDERVEFRTEADQNGRIRALDVTGPDGADVKGAPYPSNNDFDEW